MKKKILYILAPNDRFNYGDLIFPYIINHYIGDKFDHVRYISTSSSDLSKLGGIPTESYEKLSAAKCDEFDNYLIVAGGESLLASWETILSYIDKRYSSVKSILHRIFFFRRSIGIKLYNFYAKLTIFKKTKFPFTVGKNELSKFKGIYYNSVGGCALISPQGIAMLKSDAVQNILKSADYISVRDISTKEALSLANIDSLLVADSAILMSEVFKDSLLEEKVGLDKTYLRNKYIFFQGNYSYLKLYAEKISEQLNMLQKETGFVICLCPIGTALGHEDHLGLGYLEPYFNKKNIKYFKITDPSMYDIMYLIKSSALYIGSSLHGVITSMSFNVPYVGYGPKKVDVYIETWGNSTFYTNNVCNIYDCSVTALNAERNESTPSRVQKESVQKSFEAITSIILSK